VQSFTELGITVGGEWVSGSNDHWMLSLVVVSAVRNLAIWWWIVSISPPRATGRCSSARISAQKQISMRTVTRCPRRGVSRRNPMLVAARRFMEDEDDSHSSYDDANESDSNDTYVYFIARPCHVAS
jgi:hypothetical protein